jgi:hypothetical protein
MISEMIAYCGLDCNECKAFKATQTKDVEWKKRIAKHWSDQSEIKFKPEDVDCHGCKSDVISGFCRKLRDKTVRRRKESQDLCPLR